MTHFLVLTKWLSTEHSRLRGERSQLSKQGLPQPISNYSHIKQPPTTGLIQYNVILTMLFLLSSSPDLVSQEDLPAHGQELGMWLTLDQLDSSWDTDSRAREKRNLGFTHLSSRDPEGDQLLPPISYPGATFSWIWAWLSLVGLPPTFSLFVQIE